MTKKQLDMIKELRSNVHAVAGGSVADVVMEGDAALDSGTDSAKLAEWVRGAIGRLDKEVPEKQRTAIMEACGRNCAKVNHRVVETFRKRRAKYDSLDDFLDAESRSPMNGTKLWRDGGAMMQAYVPRKFSHPMRCYCALVNKLPEGTTMSPTYCQCSRAFVQQMWEEALGQPVAVVLLRSALSGADECQFCISTRA